MNNTFYFLRHGKTKVDATVPISRWELAPEGKQQAESLATSDEFDDIHVIITSTEKKAIDTAAPIAKKLGLTIEPVEDLSELNRDHGEFVPPEQYEKFIQQALSKPDISINSWETTNHALERFSQAIAEIDQRHRDKNILVVGHGFTINLYFAKLLSQLDQTYARLHTNDFGDWGIIRNGKVIKDIAKSL